MQHLRNLKQETSLFVGILVFMSSRNVALSPVEHEKSFITAGLVLCNIRQMYHYKVVDFLVSYRSCVHVLCNNFYS